MHLTKSTYGLCRQCLNQGTLNLLQQKKPNTCLHCPKQIEILFNQDPYCSSCYIQTISSPIKSQISSQRGINTGQNKTKSFYRPIDKQEVRSMKKSFLSSTGKLIKKISRLFEENQSEGDLIGFLNRKAFPIGNCQWDKLVAKVTKNSNIIYLFFGRGTIVGAFHTQNVNVEGESSVWDQESGIFSLDKFRTEPEFARVKSDAVSYSCKNKCIKFGSPSSLEITFDKNSCKLTSQLVQNFEMCHAFMYRP